MVGSGLSLVSSSDGPYGAETMPKLICTPPCKAAVPLPLPGVPVPCFTCPPTP